MASFLGEMADVIICVKYAPNKMVQEIEFQQGCKYSRFVPSDGLSADMFPYWPWIKFVSFLCIPFGFLISSLRKNGW